MPLMRSSWQMEDLFWMALRKGDAAQASIWLDAWGRSPSAKRSPQYALAQLAFADSVHDEKRTQEARKHIAGMPAAVPMLCTLQISKYEGSELGTKRAALITRYELCKGKPA